MARRTSTPPPTSTCRLVVQRTRCAACGAGLLGAGPATLARLQTMQEWSVAVRDAIGQRRLLLVIDDAWNVEDALACQVGAMYLAQAWWEQAHALLKTTYERARAEDQQKYQAAALFELAQVAAAQGDLHQAEQDARAGLTIFDHIGARGKAQEVQRWLVQLASGQQIAKPGATQERDLSPEGPPGCDVPPHD